MGFFYMGSPIDEYDREPDASSGNNSAKQDGLNASSRDGFNTSQQPDFRDSPAGKSGKAAQLSTRTLALFASATVIISSTLGFGGGYLASRYFPASTTISLEQAQQGQPTVSATSGGVNSASSSTATGSPSTTLSDNPANQATTQTLSTSPRTGSLGVAQIASLASPSVVEITTEVLVTGQRMRQYVTEGAGSGVILTTDGLIVTNNHVIAGAQTISVRLSDGQTYAAKLIGTDAQSDVALVKIEATDLSPATLGDSDKLAVGDLTVAIGNPLGELGGTVTDGIISALDREITLDDQTMNLLQTNAAINPGNSGGGLFDAAGNLIGIVVAKSSGTDVEGLGFAIPVNDVKSVITDLQRYGYVQGRINLGMTLLDIDTPQLATMYRVQETGVYVLKVDQSGSAVSAGLQSGDRIVSIDGQEVASSTDVQSVIKTHSAGDKLSVVIKRDSQQMTLDMTLQVMVLSSR